MRQYCFTDNFCISKNFYCDLKNYVNQRMPDSKNSIWVKIVLGTVYGKKLRYESWEVIVVEKRDLRSESWEVS